MAWLGKVTLGNFSDIAGAVSNFGDIAGAVTKLSESVKNIEKNFDSALGFDDKTKTEAQASDDEEEEEEEFNVDHVMTSTSQEHSEKEPNQLNIPVQETVNGGAQTSVDDHSSSKQVDDLPTDSHTDAHFEGDGTHEDKSVDRKNLGRAQGETISPLQEQAKYGEGKHFEEPGHTSSKGIADKVELVVVEDELPASTQPNINSNASDIHPKMLEDCQDVSQDVKDGDEHHDSGHACEETHHLEVPLNTDSEDVCEPNDVPANVLLVDKSVSNALVFGESDLQLVHDSSHTHNTDSEMEHLKAKVKMLDAALQGAAYQSKLKADEMSRLAIENDNLRSMVEELKRKCNDGELEVLKEEFQQRLSATERKVYALTKERDMLRREQSRKDVSLLLKEKDEIIKQVMAEGEELSKKQAAQEAQMRKLRAQIRELEEEKQRLKSKLQVEEATVESLRKDKAATEKALQEAVEKTQVELAIQKEFYVNALNEAKEAEARAGARADAEAKLELEHLLVESGEREKALVQTIEELRQVLNRAEHEAASREDMLCSDLEDLQKRCQAAELRYEELLASVPESTRPLLRQIEALQETAAVRAEAWSGVERALNARLQEAEAKAAASQERERAINERLTQTLSRMAVLEAQVSCLKAEQSQLARSLEKERQRASESRQEYLTALEAAATHEGHAKQLEVELKELQGRTKRELTEERTMRELLQQELEREKKKLLERELLLGNGTWSVTENLKESPAQAPVDLSPNRSLRRFSSISSGGSVEESFYLQASLDPTSDQLIPNTRSVTPQSYAPKGVYSSTTVEQLEALLSQREGEILLYTSRLNSLESTRNALAEELVKVTTQCEKLRAEVASLPGIRAELELLRARHTSALELMGERDEQVEELKADLADVKQMYREQIDMLVNQIEKLSSSLGSQ